MMTGSEGQPLPNQGNFARPVYDSEHTTIVVDNEHIVRSCFTSSPEKGFESLFRLYYLPLCSHAVRFVYTREVAEDIVGDVFYQLWKTGAYATIQHTYRTYLYAAVRHRAHNYLRDELTGNRTAASLDQINDTRLDETPQTLIEYDYGRTPVADVYTQIIKDLSDAEAALPVSYGVADIGRATSGAAKSLLGKVYLTQKRYADAAAKLKEVIDLSTYALLPNYADLFVAANKNSKESIFEVQYKKGNIGEGSGFANSYAPENSGNAVIAFGGGGNNHPTPDLANSYEATDPRKNVSLASSYINSSGAKVDYYYIKKYADPPVVSGDSGDDWYVLRYADVLLMYAEALNETGKPADALPYLNQVRKRVGLADKTTTVQADLRLAIEQERRVELAFEGHRWFDLVRTGRALPILQAKATAIGIKTALTENNLIFPIPQSQIDINPTKIKQNPGY